MNLDNTTFLLTMGGIILLLVGVGFMIYYLNNVQNTGTKRLIKFLRPYDLFFQEINKQEYATGFIEKGWVAINLVGSRRGEVTQIKMRLKLDVPLSAKFHIVSERARQFVVEHARKDPKNWPFVLGKFYVKTFSPDFAPEQIIESLSRETRVGIDTFENMYNGLVAYYMDGSLFEKADSDLMASAPEIKNSFILFTHITLTQQLTAEEFSEFMNETVKIAHLLEADLQKFLPVTEEEERRRNYAHKRLAAKVQKQKSS